MPDRVFHLFDDFAARHARGERPDVRAYLDRAGPEADELATLLDRFLQAVPPREPDDATVTLIESWLEGQSPLLGLRVRRGVRVEQAAETLAEELGIERARLPKLRRYFQRLERGALDAQRIDARVFEILGRLLEARAADLRAWLTPRAPSMPSVPAATSYLRDGGAEAVPEPRAEPAEWDEVDELFLGRGESA